MASRIHRLAILAAVLVGLQACAGAGAGAEANADGGSDPCATIAEAPADSIADAPGGQGDDPCQPPPGVTDTVSGEATPPPECPTGQECDAPATHADGDLDAIGDLAAQYDRGALVAQMAFAETTAAGPAIQDFADRMASSERDQRTQLEGLLTSWGTTVTYAPPTVEASIDAAAVQLLAVATGVDFDRLWLQIAAGHLLHVADLAGTLSRQTTSDDLRATAERISAECRALGEEMVGVLNA